MYLMNRWFKVCLEPDPAPGADGDKNKPEDKPGEKMFSQAEVNQMIIDRLSRMGGDNNKGNQNQQPPASNNQQQQPGNNQQPQQNPAQGVFDATAIETQMKDMKSMVVSAKVESAMAVYGIRPERIERASRLVDLTKCVDDKGNPDSAKIKKELDDLVKDFPELKATAEDGSGGTFKFGADNNQPPKGASAEEISSIFGNKKKG